MKIIFFGTPDFVIPVAESLKDNFNLVAVVTTPDQPVGRKQAITPPQIKNWAQQYNVPVLQPQQFNNETIQQLNTLLPDLFVVAAYGKIIPQQILDIPKLGAINIHPSKLPQFRGSSPIQATILSGIKNSAITIIKMDEQMDHGPVIKTIPFEINENETFQSLAEKTFRLAAQILPSTIQSQFNLIDQDHAKATYTKIITKQDGFIDLDNPPTPEQFDRMVRAYYPWPGVWAKLKTENLKLKTIKFLPNNKVQLEGKNPVDMETFFRGYPELKEKFSYLLPSLSQHF